MDVDTHVSTPPAAGRPSAALREQAVEAADSSARQANVSISLVLDPPLLEAVERLLAHIWLTGPRVPVSADLLRALSFSGGYVAAAFTDGELCGASVGFRSGRPATLHSHISGVAAGVRDRSIGFALKQHQRAWALREGLSTIEWTFDPLVARNGRFNLTKLGARATDYLPDFYGNMADGFNTAGDNDRLLASWELDQPSTCLASRGDVRTDDAAALRASGAGVLLTVGSDGAPIEDQASASDSLLLCQVPPDIVSLRAARPDLARRWRAAVRTTLGAALDSGFTAHAMTRDGWYVLTHDRPNRHDSREAAL